MVRCEAWDLGGGLGGPSTELKDRSDDFGFPASELVSVDLAILVGVNTLFQASLHHFLAAELHSKQIHSSGETKGKRWKVLENLL